MSAQLGLLKVNLKAETAEFSTGLEKAGKSLDQLEKTVTGSVAGINRAFSSFGAAVGVASFGALTTAAVQLGDQYQQLQTRIKGVSDSTAEYKKLSDQLFTISQKNGVALETTAQAFQAIARNAKSFGATNADVVKLTNAVQQLGAISGTSGESMKTAMQQFSQAMGSGTLAGDELKSIMENMPALADKIAVGLGVTRGELKKMGSEGKLTSDLVFGAILKQTEDINKEFEKVPVNLSQAMTEMQNSTMRAIGEFDRLFGISSGIDDCWQCVVRTALW